MFIDISRRKRHRALQYNVALCTFSAFSAMQLKFGDLCSQAKFLYQTLVTEPSLSVKQYLDRVVRQGRFDHREHACLSPKSNILRWTHGGPPSLEHTMRFYQIDSLSL